MKSPWWAFLPINSRALICFHHLQIYKSFRFEKKFKSEICSSLKQLKKSKKTEWKNSEWNSENKRNTKRKTKETRTWRKPELSLNGPDPLPVDPERSPRYSSQWAMIRNGERRGRYAPPPPSTVWGILGWTARLDACKLKGQPSSLSLNYGGQIDSRHVCQQAR
jgi:hypothetical protein